MDDTEHERQQTEGIESTTANPTNVVTTEDASSVSSGSSSKRVNEETLSEGTAKKARFELTDILASDSECQWEMASELVSFFQKYSVKHVTEKDLATAVGELYPLPTNLPKSMALDTHLEALLRKEGKSTVVERDSDLQKITEKALAVMGPLGAAWDRMERYKSGELTEEEMEVEMMADQMQKSAILLGQVINALTYQRRLGVLLAIGDGKEARPLLKDEKIHQQLMESPQEVLFGKAFEKSSKAEVDATKGLVDYLNRNKKEVTKKAGSGSTSKRSFPPRTKQPFRDGPSFQRGGKGHYNSNSHSNFPRKNQGYGGQGTLGSKIPKNQHGLCFHGSSARGKRPSISTKSFPKRRHPIAPSGAGENIHQKLGSTNKRSNNPEHSEGLGNSSLTHPTSGETSGGSEDESRRNESNGHGSREHVGKGSHKGSHSETGPVFEQRLRDSQSRGRFSPHHKPKETKQKHSLPSLQDGGIEGSEESSAKRGLHGKTRHEGRILCNTPEHEVSKTGPVQMEAKTLRISMPMFRVGTSPKGFHETDESSNLNPEKAQCKIGHLLRRSSDNGSESRGSSDGSRYSQIPLPETGSDFEPEEVGIRTTALHKISGDPCRQPGDEILPAAGQGEENSSFMSNKIDFTRNNTEGFVLSNRKITSYEPSHISSPSSAESPPTNLCSSPTPASPLRLTGHNFQGGSGGVGLVGEEPGFVEWVSPLFSPSRNDNFLGCGQNGGLGSSMSGKDHRGSMVIPREQTGHKHARAAGSRASNSYLYKGEKTKVYTSKDRQYYCAVISGQDGGDKMPRADKGGKENMVLPIQTQYHSDSRMDLNPFERESGFRVEERQGLFRVEVVSQNVQSIVSKSGDTGRGSLCLSNISSTAKIHELEGRSTVCGSRCLPASVVKQFPLRIPSFLSDFQGSEPSRKTRGGQDVNYNSPVAISSLVSNVTFNVDRVPNPVTPKPGNSNKPSGGAPSTDFELVSGSSGLDSIRKALEKEGLSSEACELIAGSRKRGTTKSYQYAWEKWVNWCDSREVDPFNGPISLVLNFLADLFKKGLVGRTIGTYRSAISAFHLPVDGISVGRHPRVSALMGGVSNLRPLQPKYAFTWEVETVLRYLKSWPPNEDLTTKSLSLKLAMLLSLTAISRSSELQLLDLAYLSKFSSKYSFETCGTMKHLKRNQKAKPIEFYVFADDTDLCPVEIIKAYESRSKSWRGQKGEVSKLFLSIVKPHQPITSTSIARWIKILLDMAGVDVSIFQAHSVRGASSSRALTKGLSVKAILDKGNWSRESTWQKFYHRETVSSTQEFQQKVLQL